MSDVIEMNGGGDVAFPPVVILADESAGWKIGGLTQLDRLLLALNESSRANGGGNAIDVAIWWKPDCEGAAGKSYGSSYSRSVRTTNMPMPGSFLLSTRLCPDRGGLNEFWKKRFGVKWQANGTQPFEAWQSAYAQLERRLVDAADGETSGWQLLQTRTDIARSERQLLREAAKTQDGFVARFLNRPVSRAMTRLLLKFPITPTAWTLSIFVLPILSSILLLQGTYLSILIATLFFQLHSILDGCDGEIARIKYLESVRGGRIDDLCDVIGSVLFVVSLGLGCERRLHGSGHLWNIAIEGILCGVLICANEWLLHRRKPNAVVAPTDLGRSLYPRHRDVVKHSGVLALGEKPVWFLLQLTKRDVGISLFVLLALVDLSPWIIHCWLFVTAVSFSLTIAARFRFHEIAPEMAEG